MKRILIFLGLVLGFVVGISNVAEAQVRPLYTLGPDTLTNTDTVYLTVPRTLVDRGGVFDISYQIEAEQLSGTTNITAFEQVSNQYTGGNWISTGDTVDVDGTANVLLNDKGFQHSRHRLMLIGTGTQSTKLDTWIRIAGRD